jgi:CRISPR system Cascade subunit CasE
LSVQDAYSIHRVVYSLFDDVRSNEQKQNSDFSGFLYADNGWDTDHRTILILSNRFPNTPKYGHIESKVIPESFLMHDYYGFKINLNPTKRDHFSGKTIPIRGTEAIKDWFTKKSLGSWGFKVNIEKLEVQNIDVKTFDKKGHHVTLGSATLIGELVVIDQPKFLQSFQKGIGRGKAFGLGLLQIIPLLNRN